MSPRSLVLALLISTASFSAMADIRPVSLKIYVYDQACVPQKVLLAAEKRTKRILILAGIETRWLDCISGAPAQVCAGLLPPDTLVVRIVHDSRTLSGDVFGAAFVAADGSGTYANIFYDRLRAFERDWKISTVILLSNVMAHEIGHLLLGLNAHSNWGIMKGAWDEDQLRLAERGQLLFSAEQSSTIHKKLATMNPVSHAEIASRH